MDAGVATSAADGGIPPSFTGFCLCLELLILEEVIFLLISALGTTSLDVAGFLE